jgi:hypothetical protein
MEEVVGSIPTSSTNILAESLGRPESDVTSAADTVRAVAQNRGQIWSAPGALIYCSHSSPYLDAVRQNAAGTLSNIALIHGLIASCNECVDVISECEPSLGPLSDATVE